MRNIKSYLKFFVKVICVARLRAWLVRFFGAPVNKNGWENRMLVIHLEGLGDLVMLTSILKYYKKDFPGKEIYFLIQKSSGIDEAVFGGAVDRVLYVAHRSLAVDPLYGFRTINNLRRIGFHTVTSHDPAASEVNGKLLAISLGAEEVIGYEGALVQYKKPFDPNMAMNVAYVTRKIFPRFNRVIQSVDRGKDLAKRMPNHLRHYIKSYGEISGKSHADYSPTLAIPPRANEAALALLGKHGISPGTYCLLTLGTTTPNREWSAENFAETLLRAKSFKILVVLAGAGRDVELAPRFEKIYGSNFLNLAGKTSVPEYMALIRHSFLTFSNDTAPTHIAVALKKPSLTILGLGHFGMLSLYGYSDINRWVYAKNMDCLCDNWLCIHKVGPNDPMPCIAAIKVPEVVRAFADLAGYLKKTEGYPREPFRAEFP